MFNFENINFAETSKLFSKKEKINAASGMEEEGRR